MLTIFIIAFKQMVVLFLFMAAGYFIRKKEVIKEDVGKVLSTLELYIFMPCLTVGSFAKYCTPAVLMQQVSLVGLSAVIVAGLCIPLSRLLAKHLGKTDAERDTYRYSLCFPNSGYMGYPIIGAVFGEEMLMNAMLYPELMLYRDQSICSLYSRRICRSGFYHSFLDAGECHLLLFQIDAREYSV